MHLVDHEGVPFLAGYRRVGVGMGIVAMWLAVLVHASFALRARIGPRVWRAVHYLAFVVFALATLHGVTAGTDTRATWMQLLYGAAAGPRTRLVFLANPDNPNELLVDTQWTSFRHAFSNYEEECQFLNKSCAIN